MKTFLGLVLMFGVAISHGVYGYGYGIGSLNEALILSIIFISGYNLIEEDHA